MKRYGVIGTGWIAEAYIQGAALTGEWTLEAVCSRSEERGRKLAGRYGAEKVYESPADMAADPSLEAVYIASPNALHTSQSRLFLEAGKHVLCEKPIAVEPAELRELTALAEQKGLVYLEAIMMLHLPARRVLHEAVGSLGRIRSARFDFSQLSSKYPRYLQGENPNIFNPAMATGCLMDLGLYCVYAALDLFGLPKSITAASGFLPPVPPKEDAVQSDGWGAALFHYDGLLATLTYSKVGQGFTGSEIVGDEGTLVIDSISKLTGIRRLSSGGAEEKLAGEVDKPELMSGEARDFARYIREPDASREEYRYASQLAQHACETLAEIRRQSGIVFL
ncbi:MAG: Gfo/Idh/MocA family oxidoreductase [Clostridiales bacterium]|nr:Gfo/Idh/MocA family oxidoreductase [Clostridiales bacterium]